MIEDMDNIQVPSTVNNLRETDNKMRRIRKWAVLIGVPVLMITIILTTYFLNKHTTAKQTTPYPDNSSTTALVDLQKNEQSLILSPDNSKPELDKVFSQYKTNIQDIKQSLTKYDEVFIDVKFTGNCFDSVLDGVSSYKSWSDEIQSLLAKEIPTVSADIGLNDPLLKDKYNKIRSQYQNYIAEVKIFVESQKKTYESWLDTGKNLNKVCDSTVEQVVENCKPLISNVNNYKNLLVVENNSEVITGLNNLTNYCNSVSEVIKNDDIDKLNKLNESFMKDFSIVLSTYPNTIDKSKSVLEKQQELESLLVN